MKYVLADARPAELNVVGQKIGTWDSVSIKKPAGWTLAGGRSTAKITRKWLLDGRFIVDTSEHSNNAESIALFGFEW